MATKYEEDQKLAMYHLEEMCGAVFRITKREGVDQGRKDLREIIVSLIEAEKTLERRAHDIEQHSGNQGGAGQDGSGGA